MSEQYSPKKEFVLPERNPVSHAAHKRELFWQIIFPALLALLVFALLTGLVIWAGIAGEQEVSRWADVSVIWLLPMPLFMALITLVVLAAITYGVIALIRVLPRYARLLHNYLLQVQLKVNEWSDKAVEPVLKTQASSAAWKTLRRRIGEEARKLSRR